MKKNNIFACIAASALVLLGIASCGNAKTEQQDSAFLETAKVDTPAVDSALTEVADSLKDDAKPGEDGYVTTASGLKYKVIKEGTGRKPSATDIVKVNYEGKLLDGTVFDSSYKRGEPIEFPLNRVIQGWTEGLQLMKEGSIYELYIPYNLAYGPDGAGPIPPKADLIFKVELLEVK